jgi:hypothetical protein
VAAVVIIMVVLPLVVMDIHMVHHLLMDLAAVVVVAVLVAQHTEPSMDILGLLVVVVEVLADMHRIIVGMYLVAAMVELPEVRAEQLELTVAAVVDHTQPISIMAAAVLVQMD